MQAQTPAQRARLFQLKVNFLASAEEEEEEEGFGDDEHILLAKCLGALKENTDRRRKELMLRGERSEGRAVSQNFTIPSVSRVTEIGRAHV